LKDEYTALVNLALECNSAPVLRYQFLDNGQAQAGAGALGCVVPPPVKALKDVLSFVVGNADAGVAHGDF